ncbi:hypothetical protein [Lacinutrix algicola]|uniref:hypothetical protein n=1 Tax=Lacinutrix algicola TaxID=342954 RepID=UPI0006E3A657|nr:hypothetical protein [Lacinutrix algicola]
MSFSKHCDLCENEITSFEKGLTCKLTNRKPDFKNTCSDITLDEKFLEKLERTNLELEMLLRNKKSIHLSFYFLITIGLLLIVGGYSFASWTIHSVFVWEIKITIIYLGITSLIIAFYKLTKFKKYMRHLAHAKNEKDELLEKYKIEYTLDFCFKEKIHGIQEIDVKMEFKNWTKKRTTTTYKLNS